ncbi:acyl carrier protein [Streptomyces sp. NPDC054884]|uniref:acyl carrier protein n=1 Tax=Streptomyces sp. ME08-AFT2 TaxID=3028683 RepID=UPI0029B52957|nr:acyl carrier protein [Streptomyces sp. ME08-AFT2]MDX3311419.1 acyl carrier protein [Streptomyces sp. ME08-AFT2]
MAELTIQDLIDVFNRSIGDQDPVEPEGDPSDLTFAALGFDSLTTLNAVRRIERKHGIDLGENVVSEAKTPRRLLDRINTALTGV